MIYHSFEVPRTPFTARADISSLEQLDLSRLTEEASGRRPIVPWSGSWGVPIGVDAMCEYGETPAPLKVIKFLEIPELRQDKLVLVERACVELGGQILPFKVKYIEGGPGGRLVRRFVFHRHASDIHRQLVKRAPEPFATSSAFEDPKLTFLSLAPWAANGTSEVSALSQELLYQLEATKPFGYNQLTPDLYTLPIAESGLTPFIEGFVSQLEARVHNRAGLWDPTTTGRWLNAEFKAELPVLDPLTVKAFANPFSRASIAARIRPSLGFDSRLTRALEISDYDRIEIAPLDLREAAQHIDEFPVSDFVVELAVNTPLAPLQVLVWHDRYAEAWPLTAEAKERELRALTFAVREMADNLCACDPLNVHDGTAITKLRVTKSFNDEMLVEALDGHEQLVQGAYFDFNRLSLVSLGMTSGVY